MTERNYKVTGLTKENTVIIQIEGRGGPYDSGVKAADWGDFGLSHEEAAIIHKGVTRGGKTKRPRS